MSRELVKCANEFNSIIARFILDLVRAYPDDPVVLKLRKNFSLAQSQFPAKLLTVIGRKLDEYVDQINELCETGDFGPFLEVEFEEINDSPDAENINYILQRIKQIASQLDKDKSRKYIDDIGNLLELYYVSCKGEEN